MCVIDFSRVFKRTKKVYLALLLILPTSCSLSINSDSEVKTNVKTRHTIPEDVFSRINFPLSKCNFSNGFINIYADVSDKNKEIAERFCKDAKTVGQTENPGELLHIARLKDTEQALGFIRLLENAGIKNIKAIGFNDYRSKQAELENNAIDENLLDISQFSDEQVKKIRSIHGSPVLSGVRKANITQIMQKPFLVILPSYIPEGFQVESVEVDKDESETQSLLSYNVLYTRKDTGQCFRISGGNGMFGAGPSEFKLSSIIFTEVFGLVSIGVLEDDFGNKSPDFLGMMEFLHNAGYSVNVNKNEKCSRDLEVLEFLKMVESLRTFPIQ
jgi:hypothetical protein